MTFVEARFRRRTSHVQNLRDIKLFFVVALFLFTIFVMWVMYESLTHRADGSFGGNQQIKTSTTLVSNM